MIVDLDKRWIVRARCAGKNPETFFANVSSSEPLSNPSHEVQAHWDRAKIICADCPVIKQCARDNLGELDGVWGGLDPGQRIKIRRKHNDNIRRLTGPVKREYMALAHTLRVDRGLNFAEVARIIGISTETAVYLVDLEKETRKLEAAEKEVAAKAAQEAISGVTRLPRPAPDFPAKAPKEGNAWVRYGRGVVYGYYLGQTEDDQWMQLKVKVLPHEYSVCWIKACDVKITGDVTRNVLTRVGKGSRVYGTPLNYGRGGAQEAG